MLGIVSICGRRKIHLAWSIAGGYTALCHSIVSIVFLGSQILIFPERRADETAARQEKMIFGNPSKCNVLVGCKKKVLKGVIKCVCKVQRTVKHQQGIKLSVT